MTREDTGGPLLLIYTTMSVCLSDFFTFARAFWAWISGHAFVLPAMLDSRPQSVHTDTCQSGQVSTIAVPGRREQGTSGHDRVPGYGQVTVTSTHIPGLQPLDSPPSHAGLLSCLQLRVQSCAIPTTTGLRGWQGHPGHTALGRSRSPKSRAPAAQQEENLGLYRCDGWASPSQQSVSPSQAVCQVRQGLWGPSPPTASLALAKGSPTAGDVLTSWLLRPCILLHSPGLGEHSEHCLPSSFAKHVPRELGETQAPSSAPGSCRPLATGAGRQGASSGSGP